MREFKQKVILVNKLNQPAFSLDADPLKWLDPVGTGTTLGLSTSLADAQWYIK
jgi:hypothetical protein